MTFVDKDRIAIWGWVSTQRSLAGLLFNCNNYLLCCPVCEVLQHLVRGTSGAVAQSSPRTDEVPLTSACIHCPFASIQEPLKQKLALLEGLKTI